MSMDKFKACEGTDKIRYDMLPVRDAIYAFWGSVDNNMTDSEALRMIHLGKSVERIDMYLRLGYPEEDISAELDNLLKHVSRYAEVQGGIINSDAYSALKAAAQNRISFSKYRSSVIENVENLIEVNFFETASV